MNNYFKNSILLIGLSFSLLSCGGEDLDDLEAETFSQNLVTADVTFSQSDLIGTWKLESMDSNVPVDFNDDNTEENTNILAETDCFNEMNYVFDASGNITATQARLYFNSTGIVSCESGTYNASYKLNGDVLAVTFIFNGGSVTEERIISLSEDKKVLYMSLTRDEASEYINDDRQTSTEEIGEVALSYRKTN